MHLQFKLYELHRIGTTSTWNVEARYDGSMVLGQVRWVTGWNKYAFFPTAGVMFDETGLGELSAFIITQTKLHHHASAEAKAAALSAATGKEIRRDYIGC